MERKWPLQVRCFGLLELENGRGRVGENPSRQPRPWLLLKYLLCQGGRPVHLEELEHTIWPEGNGDSGAARVRLRRLRQYLAPLGLDGVESGLVLFHGGYFSLNPQYTLELDTETFQTCLEQARNCPKEDPAGLAACTKALELYRGPFLAGTRPATWLAPMQKLYARRFEGLLEDSLSRCQATGDVGPLPLLCRRAAALAPENAAFHQSLISYLGAQRETAILAPYVASLTGAPWLGHL